MDSLSSNPSRKRARSPDADCEECMPISKRIHNLNIRSRGCSIDDDDNPLNNNAQLESNCCCSTNRCHPQPGTSAATDSTHWLSTAGGGPATHHHHHHHHNNGHPTQPMNPHQQQTLPNAFPCLPPQHANNPCQPNHPAAGVIPNMNGLNSLEPYEPELDATENPHYYHQNRLLYVAHIERVRRTKPD